MGLRRWAGHNKYSGCDVYHVYVHSTHAFAYSKVVYCKCDAHRVQSRAHVHLVHILVVTPYLVHAAQA